MFGDVAAVMVLRVRVTAFVSVGKHVAVMRSSLSHSRAGSFLFCRPGRARCFDAVSAVSVSLECKFVTLQPAPGMIPRRRCIKVWLARCCGYQTVLGTGALRLARCVSRH